MILILTIGLVFSSIIFGYLIYASDASPTVVTLILTLIMTIIPLFHETETMLFVGIYYATALIVLMINTILIDIYELKRQEDSNIKQKEENLLLKEKLLDYFKQGYLIIDKYKGFKYTYKALDELVNVELINQICEKKGDSDIIEKQYIIKYNRRLRKKLDKKDNTDRLIQVLNIKNGEKVR